MTIRQWSTTASGNSNVSGINFSEGQNPSTVNNSARELMAQVRQEYTPERWGWVICSATASVNSQTVFKLTGNQTTDYVANRRVKLTGGSTTLYATVVSSSFTTETTITITGASGSLSSSMSIAWLSTVYGQNLPANVITTSGTSTFTSETVFLATASFASAVKVSGTLSVGGDIVAAGDLTVAGSATFSGTVQMLTALSVSGTLAAGSLLVGGAPVGGGGWSLIGSTALGAGTLNARFSGSWSAYTAFAIYAAKISGTATAHAFTVTIFQDGGTTGIASLDAGSPGGTNGDFKIDIIGNGMATKIIAGNRVSSGVGSLTFTSTAGYINCIQVGGTSHSLSVGTIFLFGMKG